MKIISLCGEDNCGKTTSIKYLLCKILHEHKNARSIYWYKNLTEQEILDSMHGKRGRLHDNISTIVDLDGIAIGITSFGDDVGTLRLKFSRFQKFGCKIYVCASHPEPKMQQALAEYVSKTEDFILVEKSRAACAEDYGRENKAAADALYDALMECVREIKGEISDEN